MSLHTTKPTKWPVRPAKTQISLGIHWEMGMKLDFGDLDLIFKVTPALWMSKFDQKKTCLPTILWTKWCILAKIMYCIIGIIKSID